MFFRTLCLTLPFTLLGISSAFAQSTPIPKPGTPEHSTTPQLSPATLPGTFSELESDHTLGQTTAPITLIIYASITCPHCSLWFKTTWPDVIANYVDTGKVRIVFREFPTPPAQLAIAGFQIANCAPEDKFFELIEHQMVEQDSIIQSVKDGKGLETYLAIAKMAGLNSEAEMNTCFGSIEGRKRLAKSMELAHSGNIGHVPNFIINGTVYEKSSDYLPLSRHFEALLSQGFSPLPKP